MAFGRASSETIENGSDAVVWQHASELAQKLHGLHVGLPAILTTAVVDDFEPSVIPALPLQHQMEPIGLDSDDDLLEDSSQNPLADFDGGGGMVPQLRQVISKRQQRRALVIAKRAWLFPAQALELLLDRATAARRSFQRRSSSPATSR